MAARRFPFLLWVALALPAGVGATPRYFAVTPGSHPHDVAAAPGANGSIYFTAQRTGKLGILDPKTGKLDEIPLGTGSAPHGVLVGPDGAVWITDGGQNAILRFDPKSRTLRTNHDKVWLSDWGSNALIRFDPESEAFQSFPSDHPSANARQLGGRAGEVWGAESGTDRLVTVPTSSP